MFHSRIELERLQLEQRRKADYHQRYVSSLLTNLRIVIADNSPESKMSMHDFMNMHPRTRIGELDPDVLFRSANMRDGIGIDLISTDGVFTHRNRLSLPHHDKPQLTRVTLDYDVTSGYPRSTEAIGVEEMAKLHEMPDIIGRCLGAAAVEGSYGWQNAYK